MFGEANICYDHARRSKVLMPEFRHRKKKLASGCCGKILLGIRLGLLAWLKLRKLGAWQANASVYQLSFGVPAFFARSNGGAMAGLKDTNGSALDAPSELQPADCLIDGAL